MSGMKLFDNYEEDGQLSLFSADYDDWDDDWEEEAEESAETPEEDSKTKENVAIADAVAEKSGAKTPKAVETYEKAVAGLEMTNAGPTVRVKYCASCGKLLFVREETAGFHSECNNCGIKYFQKL